MNKKTKEEIMAKKQAEVKSGTSKKYTWSGQGNYIYGGMAYGPGSEIEMLVSDYENEPEKTKALFGHGNYKKPAAGVSNELEVSIEKAPPPKPIKVKVKGK